VIFFVLSLPHRFSPQKIDRECALVPRGALSLDTGKKVIPNTNYQGLSYETSTQLRAFMHLRNPENLQGIALMRRPGILKTDDFLDCIDNDLPKGMFLMECFI
jgi:radial spoke head protein 9